MPDNKVIEFPAPTKPRIPQPVKTTRISTRPVVHMLDDNKLSLFRRFWQGVSEKSLSKVYDLSREETELVLHEVLSRILRSVPPSVLREAISEAFSTERRAA